jgi:hypothetical protein
LRRTVARTGFFKLLLRASQVGLFRDALECFLGFLLRSERRRFIELVAA